MPPNNSIKAISLPQTALLHSLVFCAVFWSIIPCTITAFADYLLVELRRANLPLDVQVRGTHGCFPKIQSTCRKRSMPIDKGEGDTFRAPRTVSSGLNTANNETYLQVGWSFVFIVTGTRLLKPKCHTSALKCMERWFSVLQVGGSLEFASLTFSSVLTFQ